MDLLKKMINFDALVSNVKTAQQAVDVSSLIPKGAPPVVGGIDAAFKPVLDLFGTSKGVSPSQEQATNAMQNLAHSIDGLVAGSENKEQTLAQIKQKIEQLSNQPLFSSVKDNLLSVLNSSSSALGGASPSVSPTNALVKKDEMPKLDLKKEQKELFLASDIVKGIAQAMKKPNANKNVLLARLNKYRLVPMAKIFVSLNKQDKNHFDKNMRTFFSNLKGLFVQVSQTFTPEELDVLKADPTVKQALDTFKGVGFSEKGKVLASKIKNDFIKLADKLSKKY